MAKAKHLKLDILSNFLYEKTKRKWHHYFPAYRCNDLISSIAIAIYSAVSYIGLTGGTVMAGATFVANVLVYGALSVGTSLLSSLASKSGKHTTMSLGGLQVMTQNPTDPIRLIYGKNKISPVRIFAYTNKTSLNLWLHMICEWGEGPLEGPETDADGEMIWFDDQRMQEYKLGNSEYFYHEFYDGSLDQMPSAALHAAFDDWYDASRGTAYSYFRLRYVEGVYIQVPNVTCLMKGRKLFDHRYGTVAYANNPALVRFDYMTHPRIGGIPGSLFNKTTITDSATWYDAHGMEFNGCVIDRQEFQENLEQIELSCKGKTIWTGSEYKMLIYKYDAAVMTLDERDIQASPDGANAIGIADAKIADVPTRFLGWFCDEEDGWRVKPAYWPQIAQTTPEDRPPKEISLIGITSYVWALRILKFLYLRAKHSRTYSFVANPGGPVGDATVLNRISGLQDMDMVEVKHNSDYPIRSIPSTWIGEILRVDNLSTNQANQIALSLVEEAEEIYEETVNAEIHQSYIPTLQDIAQTPTNLSATTGEDTSTVREVDAYIQFEFDNMGADKYQVRYRKKGKTAWTTIPAFQNPGGEVDVPVFTGFGTLAMESGGDYQGDDAENIRVEIDGAGSPNTFKWSDTGGALWNDTGVAITGDWQDLDDNIKVKFDALTGGIVGDRWDFLAKPKTPIIFLLGGLPLNTEYEWQACSIIGHKKSDWATPDSTITTWSPEALATTGLSIAASAKKISIIVTLTVAPGFVKEYDVDKWVLYRSVDSANFGDATELTTLSRGTLKHPDKEVDSSHVYRYWVKVLNKSGLYSTEVGPTTGATPTDVEAADSNPPSVDPSSLTLTLYLASDNAKYYDEAVITFLGSIDDEGNLDGYNVQLWNDTGSVKVGPQQKEDATANDETAVTKTVIIKGHFKVKTAGGANITYKAKVQAYDKKKNKTAWVTSAGVSSPASGPAPPTWRSTNPVTADGLKITLHINKNSEKDIAGYEWHASASSGFTPSDATLIATGSKKTSTTWTAPAAGTYYFKVRAYDTEDPPNYSGYSIQESKAVTAKLSDDTTKPTPNPVTGISVVTESYYQGRIEKIRANISWTACTDDSGKAVKYEVHLWRTGETTKARKYTAGKDNSISIPNLEPDTQYYCYVNAYDFQKNYTDNQVSPVSVLTSHDTTGPSMTNVALTATQKVKLVLLRWSYSSGSQESDFKEWIIYRNSVNNSGTATEIDRKSRQTRSYRDVDTPADGTTYYYWLKGVDEAGNVSSTFCTVASSSSQGVLTDDTTPPTPDPPTGLGNDTPFLYDAESKRMKVRLYWNACTDDSGKAIKYQVLYRKQGDPTNSKMFSTTTSVVIPNLVPGDTLEWTVGAIDWAENSTSYPAFQQVVIGDDTVAPGVPTLVEMYVKTGGVLFFDWVKNSENDAKRYDLYLSTSAATPTKGDTSKIYKRIAHPTSQTSIPIGKKNMAGGGAIVAGTAYYAWLSCTDRAGNESNLTAFSGTITPRKGIKKNASGAIVDEDDVNVTVDHVADGSTYKRTTANEKTGAGRGYAALDSGNILVAGSADFSRAYTNKGALATKNTVATIDANAAAFTEGAAYSSSGYLSIGISWVNIGGVTISAKEATDVILLKANCSIITNPSPSNCVIVILIGKTVGTPLSYPSYGRIPAGRYGPETLTVLGMDAAPVVGNNTYYLWACAMPVGDVTVNGQIGSRYIEGLRRSR